MYKVFVEDEQLAGEHHTARDARKRALDQLDSLSIIAHRLKMPIAVTIRYYSEEIWSVTLGSAYKKA